MSNTIKKLLIITLFWTVLFLTWCWQTKITDHRGSLPSKTIKDFKNYWCKWNECYVKIKDKAIKRYNDVDKYLIYTNIGTFKIEDSLLYLVFSASDAYWLLQKENCYIIKKHIFSFRIPFFSSYPNIVWIKKVKCIDETNKNNSNLNTKTLNTNKDKLSECLNSCNVIKDENSKKFCIKECISNFKK